MLYKLCSSFPGLLLSIPALIFHAMYSFGTLTYFAIINVINSVCSAKRVGMITNGHHGLQTAIEGVTDL